MIRLALLLLGVRPLRTYWWTLAALSVLCLVLGVIFIADIFNTAVVITTDIIGVLFVIEGVVRLSALAAIGFPNATTSVLKALFFFALGFMAIDMPWDDNIVATAVLGSALILDGLFRCAAAVVIRSVRWRHTVLVRRPQHGWHLHELYDAWLALLRRHHVYRLHDPGRFSEKRRVKSPLEHFSACQLEGVWRHEMREH